jgi:FAD/FMN-containing dehydrogenase
VIACVAYARDHVLPLAIRGGGHHGGGFAVWDNALVIDLSGLRSTSVDPRPVRSESTAVVSGATLITPLERSGWPYRQVSSRQPGLPG